MIAGRKWGETAYTVVAEVGEYAGKVGKDCGVGNGCGKGDWKVAFAFARPVFNLNTEYGAPNTF